MLLCCLARTSSANTVFYVRVGGNDQANGSSAAAAFASIGHAAASLRNPGDRVVVGPGLYPEGNITPSDNGIEGHPIEFVADVSGAATGDPPGEVIVAPAMSLGQPPPTTGFLLFGRHHIVIDGFTITGASDAGVQVRRSPAGVDSGDVSVLNTTVMNGRAGIDIISGGEVVLQDDVVSGNQSVGIAIAGTPTKGVLLAVSNNQVMQNLNHGIFIDGAVGGTVELNTVRGNAGTGILLRASAGVSFVENSVSENREDGIGIGTGHDPGVIGANLRLTQNDVQRNDRTGISIVATGVVTVEQNLLTGNGSAGISVAGDGAANMVLRGNHVSSSGTDGVALQGASAVVLADNSTNLNDGNGVRVRQSRNLEITGNAIASSGESGIDAIVTGSITADRNSIAGSARVGLSIIADSGGAMQIALSNNLLRANTLGAAFVSGASAGTVANNEVNNTPADGFVIRSSTNLYFLGNHIADSAGNGLAVGGPTETPGRNFVFRDNRVEVSRKAGITVYASGPLEATGNTVRGSGDSGLSIVAPLSAPVLPRIANNTAESNGAHGIFLQGIEGAVVQNNTSVRNAATGITLRRADLTIAVAQPLSRIAASTALPSVGAKPQHLLVNNLVYANGADGLAVGSDGQAVPKAGVMNNTVYGNGGWGLLLGSNGGASPGAMVIGNIFDRNQTGGIALDGDSTCGYVSGFNINRDGYGQQTPKNGYDAVADPLFVDPNGGNFHLQQGRGGQNINSPAVDAGPAARAAIGLVGTTAQSGVPDVGTIDIGYHYGASADQDIVVPVPYMPIFVRVGGDDNNDGLDPQRPLATIQEGARRARAGGTVVVGPGRYPEGDVHPSQKAGRASFFADSSGMATGDLPGVVLVDANGKDTAFNLLNSCNAVVDGFFVTGALQAGIQIRPGADGVSIKNNVAFSNANRGIEILGRLGTQNVIVAGGEITNNVVYANGTGGIRLDTVTSAVVTNNTVYGNGQDGILVGGSDALNAAPGASVLRNVAAANAKGIKVEDNSFTGYLSGFNIVSGDGSQVPFSGNTPQSDSDYIDDPKLVSPKGADQVLGGSGFLDDDFHLQQDTLNVSSAVDVDFDVMNALAAGSTQRDFLPDLGPLDAGYHYPFLPRLPIPSTVRTVVFVRTSGDDRNSGTSPAAALASIGKALAVVRRNGLVVIGPGRYPEGSLRFGGVEGASGLLVLYGDPTGRLTGDTAGVIVVDASRRGAPVVTGPALIDGIQFTGARGPGLRVLRDARGVTIRNSVVCGNSGGGLLSMGDGVNLTNNLVSGNAGFGISVRLRAARRPTRLLNNTVAANQGEGIAVRELGGRRSHALLYNNVVSQNTGVGISVRAIRGVTSLAGNNLNTDGYGHGNTSGRNDVTAAPQFAGASISAAVRCTVSDDFRVSAESPAIDAGASTASEIGLGARSVTPDGSPDGGAADLGFHNLNLR